MIGRLISHIFSAAKDPEQRRQFIRYVIVGGTGFAIEYAIFWTMLLLLPEGSITIGKLTLLTSTAANSVAMFLVFWYNFLLNRKWSFKSTQNPVRQAIMQASLFAFNMVVSNLLIGFCSEVLHIIPQISKFLVMGLVVMWNFILYKTVIFK